VSTEKTEPPEERADLVLIDGNSLLYRAFFALPPLTNAHGEVTNAAYGFTTMLFKVLDEAGPKMVAVAFDLPGPTFRHEIYEDYKATRRAMPDELGPQFDMAREILDALHIPTYGVEGYEADDIIGTLASQAEREGKRVLIVTGDLDELQLVSDRVSVMVTRRGITDTVIYDEKAVEERYGLTPAQLPDFRSLKGDASDNIPGVPGIGEKTAAKLIGEFGSLENLLERVGEVKPPRAQSAVAAHADLARRAKELSLIVCDLPVEYDPEALRLQPPDTDRLVEIFRRLDFRSLLKRVESTQEPATSEHDLISTPAAAEALAGRLAGAEKLVLLPIAGEGPGLRALLFGVCLLSDGRPAVVMGEEGTLDDVLAPLKPLLESSDVAKVGHDLKRSALLLQCHGIDLARLSFDTMLGAHLVNPSRRVEELSAVISDYLQTESPPLLQKTGPDPGAAAILVEHVASLQPILRDLLEEIGVSSLFRDLEMPLIPVLLEMERTGIAVDCTALAALSEELGARATELESEIYALAGEEFNIGSPVQLQQILFEKLQLPPDKAKRTKSGYSTAADVLANLSEYEIVAKILEYREVTKLKSTYVDALPPLVDPRTGRIHTSFNQAVTATGRLSSTAPNLQNIPIRTEAGTKIRRAFIAGGPDLLLLSADYSQIELRILAHITRDENLIAIFLRDEDLHSAAAVEIFGVAAQEVTAQMRAFAKMVNFGIPYGMSDFRLAREMGIPQQDARRYMQRYFDRFPRVRDYVGEMPDRAREQGYVETLLGRRRPLPDLRSRAPAVRQAAERMAINTPMQGSAADIIKLAMLRVHDELQQGPLRAKMLLQVHDELVLETPRSELAETASLLCDCMSGAFELIVPLKVEVKAGENWLEMTPVP
jgi:DNA polymerase-1